MHIVLPSLGDSFADAKIIKWLKNVGDNIVKNEPILEIEVNKAIIEITSQSDGILTNILIPNDCLVRNGDILGNIEERQKEKQMEQVHVNEPLHIDQQTSTKDSFANVFVNHDMSAVNLLEYSPSVRNMLAYHKIDPRKVTMHGARLVASDIKAFLRDFIGNNVVKPLMANVLPETVASTDVTQEVVVPANVLQETVASADVPQEVVVPANVLPETVASTDVTQEIVVPANVLQETVASTDVKQEIVVHANMLQETVASADVKQEIVVPTNVLQETVASTDVKQEIVVPANMLQETVASADVLSESIPQNVVTIEDVKKDIHIVTQYQTDDTQGTTSCFLRGEKAEKFYSKAVQDINMTPILYLCKQYKEAYNKKYHYDISYIAFLIQAVLQSIDDDYVSVIMYSNDYVNEFSLSSVHKNNFSYIQEQIYSRNKTNSPPSKHVIFFFMDLFEGSVSIEKSIETVLIFNKISYTPVISNNIITMCSMVNLSIASCEESITQPTILLDSIQKKAEFPERILLNV